MKQTFESIDKNHWCVNIKYNFFFKYKMIVIKKKIKINITYQGMLIIM